MNTDVGIGLDVCVKAKGTETLTVAQGLAPSELGQEIIRRRRSFFSDFAMARKEVIGRALEGDWYGSHEMNGSGSLREDNAERKISRCADLRSGLGVVLENAQGDTYEDTHSPLYLTSDRGFHVYLRLPNGQTTHAQDTAR